MKNENRFLDDIATIATGAVGAFSGFRQQIRKEIRTQINRFIGEMDLIPREDFTIVEAMVREARLHNQKLEKRLAALEGKATTKPAQKKPGAVKKKATAKTVVKKARKS